MGNVTRLLLPSLHIPLAISMLIPSLNRQFQSLRATSYLKYLVDFVPILKTLWGHETWPPGHLQGNLEMLGGQERWGSIIHFVLWWVNSESCSA